MQQFRHMLYCCCVTSPSMSLTAWVKANFGQTCDGACQARGQKCDANKQSELTSNEAVAAAFKEAGYTCKSTFHGARDYAGTPFSSGRSNGDCAPLRPGAKSVCNKLEYNSIAPLCYCVGGMFICKRIDCQPLSDFSTQIMCMYVCLHIAMIR